MISFFFQRRRQSRAELLYLGQGHKAGGRTRTSAQVFFPTSHFLPREQYTMLLGSKCQTSRIDSCSAGEEGGPEGAGDLPRGGL